jgi:hypothetical protein
MDAQRVSDGRRLLVKQGLALGLVAVCLASAQPHQSKASPLSVVNIGGRNYLTGDLKLLASRLVKTTSIRFVLTAISRCRGVQVRGFVSTSGFGLTAYLPTSLAGCVETPRGGPGGGGPCVQGFKTPQFPDPTGVAGVTGRPARHYVMFAASGSTVCQDISTQVPGGVWARTGTSVPGLPAGSVALVKCQLPTSEGLYDYLAPTATALPASKPTYWIHDYYFESGATRRLAGVPACSGFDVFPP